MNNIILGSTFFLTLLLMVGLVFFLRGAVKDRTQQITLKSQLPLETLLESFQSYFEQRAYRVKAFDAQENQITWEGFVRPSWFLAIFLSVLAALGLLCFGLVLSLLFPNWGNFSLALTLLAPLVGLFYWQNAARTEQVLLKLDSGNGGPDLPPTSITITGHRDELLALQKSLKV